MGTGVVSLGEKRPVREADHSLPSIAEVNHEWGCSLLSFCAFMTYIQRSVQFFTWPLSCSPKPPPSPYSGRSTVGPFTVTSAVTYEACPESKDTSRVDDREIF